MGPDELVARRQADWGRLEALVGRANRGVDALSPADLGQLGRLYRLAASDLAVAQRDFADHPVGTYLNQLVAGAHAVVYQAEPLRWRQLRRFYAETFPQLYRRLLPYTLLALALFILPAMLAFAAVARQPDRIVALLGPGVAELQSTVEDGELWTDIAPAIRSAAAAAVMTNNIQVMFMAFAGGMTGGLLTVWAMLMNGLLLGAVFGLLAAHGMAGGLADFVVAHGVIELSVVFVAGGCGLALADALLRPGLLTRRQALLDRGADGVRLILGCVPLLVLAGLIEGFVSPSRLPFAGKLAVGLGTGLALHAWWLLGGRPGRRLRDYSSRRALMAR